MEKCSKSNLCRVCENVSVALSQKHAAIAREHSYEIWGTRLQYLLKCPGNTVNHSCKKLKKELFPESKKPFAPMTLTTLWEHCCNIVGILQYPRNTNIVGTLLQFRRNTVSVSRKCCFNIVSTLLLYRGNTVTISLEHLLQYPWNTVTISLEHCHTIAGTLLQYRWNTVTIPREYFCNTA